MKKSIICFGSLLAVLQSNAQTFATETEVRTEIFIKASPDKLWQLLTDFEHYPQWHPYIQKVEGHLKLHKKMKVTLKRDTSSTTSEFSAYILELKPYEKFSWGGSLGFIFRAKHYFIIQPIGADSVLLIQGEYWKGLFGKSYGRKIYKQVYSKFELMNGRAKEILEGDNR